MGFSQKIKGYFNDKKLNIKEISKIMEGYNPQLIGRYINSDNISSVFINNLIKYFPDIDLNYLLKEDPLDLVQEESVEYKSRTQVLVNEIKQRLEELEKIVSQK